MEWIQIILIIFAVFAYSRAILQFKKKSINTGEFLFWSILWISVIITGVFPNWISTVSSLFGVGRAADFMIYLSIIALFYLMFRLYVKMDKLNQEQTKLVREIAINRAKKK